MVFKRLTNENVRPDLTFGERVAYGFGDFSSNILYSALGVYLMLYYTDVIGVSAIAVGIIMTASRVFDGISDLIMGVIIDRTKSPYGKARVWILRLVIPYAIGNILLFAVPTGWSETAKLIYIFCTYNLAFTILFTGINLPYATLTALMTQNQYERSVLAIFRMVLATCGTLFIKICTLPVVRFFGGENDPTAWTMTFVVFGGVEIITFMITFLFTRERVHTAAVDSKKADVPVGVAFKALLHNKYWIIATINLLLLFIVMGVSNAAEAYYVKQILGDPDLIGTFGLAVQLTQIGCMVTFVAFFVKKYGKRNVMFAGAAIMAVGYAIMGIGSESLPIMIFGCILRGIGNAGIAACQFAMVVDTIEYGEWKSGVRTDGLINSAASFGQKMGNGFSMLLLSAILSWGGYVGTASTQTESALFAIKAGYIYIPIVLTIVQLIVLLFYKLDYEYPTILAELNARQRAAEAQDEAANATEAAVAATTDAASAEQPQQPQQK